jgi:hypothetical protein
MLRTFSLITLFFCAFCVLPGCGSNSPEFDETQTTAQTEEEIQEALDYEQQMQQQFEDTAGGPDSSQ